MANCNYCGAKLPHPNSIAGFCDTDCLDKYQRKDFEQYAEFRTAPRMMEKALNQPMQKSFKVTTICNQPLTDEEKFLLEYSLKHTAMKAKYINNKDIDLLRNIARKIGLAIDRELELCKD